MKNIKIMSFNTQHCLNFLEKKIDFKIMAKTIRSCGADIVGLNEMRAKGKREDYQDQTGYLSRLSDIEHFFFAKAIDVGGENPYGNAILSKFPIKEAEVIPISDPAEKKYRKPYESRCILKAKLENGLTVLVTHFGLNPDEQQNAVDTLLRIMPKEKCVLMGDFNLCPDNEILNRIRERMVDAAEKFESKLLSFPSDHPNKKIDYIFVTPDIKVESADIPPIIASDHRPHTATLWI